MHVFPTIHAFKYTFDGCFNYLGMGRQRLGNAISNTWMPAGHFGDFHGNIAACVSPGREKIWMDSDVARSLLNQPREPLGNGRMFNLQEGRFDQSKAATFTDGPGRLSHIFVCFRATAAVTDYE